MILISVLSFDMSELNCIEILSIVKAPLGFCNIKVAPKYKNIYKLCGDKKTCSKMEVTLRQMNYITFFFKKSIKGAVTRKKQLKYF